MCLNGLTGFQKLKMFSVSTASMWFTGSVETLVVASQPVTGGVSQLFLTTTEPEWRGSHIQQWVKYETHTEKWGQAHTKHFTSEFKTSLQKSSSFCFDWKDFQALQAEQKKPNSSDLPIRMIRNEQSLVAWKSRSWAELTNNTFGPNVGVVRGKKSVRQHFELISGQTTMILKLQQKYISIQLVAA